jgi:hypothetical protein
MNHPVAGLRQPALTTTAPHSAGDGTLPHHLFLKKSFHQKASRLFWDSVTGTVNKALAAHWQSASNVAKLLVEFLSVLIKMLE